MLGRRLSARAARHQRLARRLRARHVLSERRDAVQRARAGRVRPRVRFLRPISRTLFVVDDIEPVALDNLPMLPAAELSDTLPEAPVEVVSSVTPAATAAPTTATALVQPELEPVVPTRSSSEPPLETHVESLLADAGADETPLQTDASSLAMQPVEPVESVESAEAHSASPVAREIEPALDEVAEHIAPSDPAPEARASPQAPAEQRVARPLARPSLRADAVAASLAAAPEPDAPAADSSEEPRRLGELPAPAPVQRDDPPVSAPPSPLDAQSLFTPREPDARAPAAWLERLTRAAEGGTPSAPPASPFARPATDALPFAVPQPVGHPTLAAVAPDTVVLPPSARRFLRPLVGVDPDDVTLRAGPAAAHAVAAQAADALAFECEVVLGAEAAQSLDAPRTLGLLAHELTHVARRASPRFVPPIARAAGPATTDEEALASRVEGRVTRAAERGVDRSSVAAPVEHVAPRARLRARVARAEEPTGAEPEVRDTVAPATGGAAWFAPREAPATLPGQPPIDAETFDWGGLPAPWEPLPVWVTETLSPAPPTGSLGVAPAFNGASAPALATSAPLVQRAGEERSVEPPAATPTTPAAHTAAAQPPATPDLDELARQVYGILRRRLAAEARRAG